MVVVAACMGEHCCTVACRTFLDRMVVAERAVRGRGRCVSLRGRTGLRVVASFAKRSAERVVESCNVRASEAGVGVESAPCPVPVSRDRTTSFPDRLNGKGRVGRAEEEAAGHGAGVVGACPACRPFPAVAGPSLAGGQPCGVGPCIPRGRGACSGAGPTSCPQDPCSWRDPSPYFPCAGHRATPPVRWCPWASCSRVNAPASASAAVLRSGPTSGTAACRAPEGTCVGQICNQVLQDTPRAKASFVVEAAVAGWGQWNENWPEEGGRRGRADCCHRSRRQR